MSAWPHVIGRASTGLTGPYAFPSKWTFQRRGELQKTTRRRARHLRMQAGQFLRGQPLYIEAVTPPLKAIRHLLGELAPDRCRTCDVPSRPGKYDHHSHYHGP